MVGTWELSQLIWTMKTNILISTIFVNMSLFNIFLTKLQFSPFKFQNVAILAPY